MEKKGEIGPNPFTPIGWLNLVEWIFHPNKT